MQYIRTKDGVYEINRYYEPRDYYWVKQDCEQPIGSDEIIKQADTIEELCDRAIVKEHNVKEPRIYNISKHNFKEAADTWFNLRKVEWVKFAIWTDKGLTFVAEMNSKGELELL